MDGRDPPPDRPLQKDARARCDRGMLPVLATRNMPPVTQSPRISVVKGEKDRLFLIRSLTPQNKWKVVTGRGHQGES